MPNKSMNGELKKNKIIVNMIKISLLFLLFFIISNLVLIKETLATNYGTNFSFNNEVLKVEKDDTISIGYSDFYKHQGFFCAEPGQPMNESGLIYKVTSVNNINTKTTKYTEDDEQRLSRDYILSMQKNDEQERQMVYAQVNRTIDGSNRTVAYYKRHTNTVETVNSLEKYKTALTSSGKIQFGANTVDVSGEQYPYAKYLQRNLRQGALWLIVAPEHDSQYIPLKKNQENYNRARIGSKWYGYYAYLKDAIWDLKNEANNFAKYIVEREKNPILAKRGQNGAKIAISSNNSITDTIDLNNTNSSKYNIYGEYIYIGPYTFGDKNIARYYDSTKGWVDTKVTASIDVYIKNSSGGYDKLAAGKALNGKDIYFRVNKGTTNDKLIECTLSTVKIDMESTCIKLKNGNGTKSYQKVIQGSGTLSSESLEIKVIINSGILELPKLEIIKVNENGEKLNGAKANITITTVNQNTNNSPFEYKLSNEELPYTVDFEADSNLNLLAKNYLSHFTQYATFKLVIEETVAPLGYKLPEKTEDRTFTFYIQYDIENKIWQTSDKYDGKYTKIDNMLIKIDVVNTRIPPPEIVLHKVDIVLHKVDVEESVIIPGAKFKVYKMECDDNTTYTGNEEFITDENGDCTISLDKCFDNTKVRYEENKTYTLYIRETAVPSKYKKSDNDLVIEMKYENSSWSYTLKNKIHKNDTISGNTITVHNQPVVPPKITLIKFNENGEPLSKVKFQAEVTKNFKDESTGEELKENVILQELETSSSTNGLGKDIAIITIDLSEEFDSVSTEDTFDIILKETKPLNGYQPCEDIKLKVTYNEIDGSEDYLGWKVENNGTSEDVFYKNYAFDMYEKIKIDEDTSIYKTDGIITVDDANYVLKYSAGLYNDFPDEKTNWFDVNQDKKVNSGDAVRILQELKQNGPMVCIMNTKEPIINLEKVNKSGQPLAGVKFNVAITKASASSSGNNSDSGSGIIGRIVGSNVNTGIDNTNAANTILMECTTNSDGRITIYTKRT